MRAFILLISLATVLSQGVVDFRPYDTTARSMFHGSDWNVNGIFERFELTLNFQMYDVNHDNRTHIDEYVHYVSSQTPSLHDFSYALFADYDEYTKDGFLDPVDLDEYYKKLDTDDNGSVSEDEFAAHWVDLFQKFEHLHGVDYVTTQAPSP